LWPENYFLSENSFYIFTCLVSISGIEYAKTFLLTKKNSPIIHKLLSFYHLFYFLILTLIFLKEIDIAYNLLQPIQGTIAFIMLFTSLKLVLKKSRQALFYFISWSVLFISILLFIFTNIGFLPYNLFTSQIMLYGSALQVILLSIAQADKYNILKLEEQKAQEKALSIANLNERIIREQNVVLEEKVNLRTVELSNTNIQLNDALVSLKDAQMQLIEKEKMSSLGQLTAGIAHEINNPINFVTGNIKPLKRDVFMVIDLLDSFEKVAKSSLSVEEKTAKLNMLKLDLDFDYLNEEINFLLKGIEEGASRTAEIVKGLKIFSRTDEFETKIANVNDGLNSTLVLLNNLIGTKIKVVKEFDNENAVIEHFPGKLNQVFMNILSNSIFAINQKWENETGGVINLKTENINGKFVITFTDNGVGMSEDVLNKIYEPFYTTKPVGAGTGLGMSIVYKTIELHKGKITIDSKLNQGTTIKIEIPNKLII
jgi:signal transduction histidine kinase